MKVIKREKQRFIIEHDGMRYAVPEEVYNKYKHGLYTIAELIFHSLPVSIPWAEFIDLGHLTPERIERELYRHGIHTVEDMVSNNQGARAAIMKAVNLSPGVLLREAKKKIN